MYVEFEHSAWLVLRKSDLNMKELDYQFSIPMSFYKANRPSILDKQVIFHTFKKQWNSDVIYRTARLKFTSLKDALTIKHVGMGTFRGFFFLDYFRHYVLVKSWPFMFSEYFVPYKYSSPFYSRSKKPEITVWRGLTTLKGIFDEDIRRFVGEN